MKRYPAAWVSDLDIRFRERALADGLLPKDSRYRVVKVMPKLAPVKFSGSVAGDQAGSLHAFFDEDAQKRNQPGAQTP